MSILLNIKLLRTVLGVIATCCSALAAENSFPEISPVLAATSTGMLALLHVVPRA